jgi:hypothetical protein
MLVFLPLLLIVVATNLWSISGGVAHARRALQSPGVVVVSSASYERGGALAPEAFATAFGFGLASTTEYAADTDPMTPGVQLMV